MLRDIIGCAAFIAAPIAVLAGVQWAFRLSDNVED